MIKRGRYISPEYMVVLKFLRNCLMHIAKLRAVTLIKDHYHMFFINWMLLIFTYKNSQLLNRGHYDFVFVKYSFTILIFQLFFKYLS